MRLLRCQLSTPAIDCFCTFYSHASPSKVLTNASTHNCIDHCSHNLHYSLHSKQCLMQQTRVLSYIFHALCYSPNPDPSNNSLFFTMMLLMVSLLYLVACCSLLCLPIKTMKIPGDKNNSVIPSWGIMKL